MNIFILDKNYNQIGMLSNEGANPQAPYFDDLYTQELDTGADTFYFTTLSTRASRDFIEIGNHIIFQFNNRHRLFAISDLEFEHKEGRNVIGVYAEGVGFQLLETFMGEFEGGDDTDGDGEVDDNSGEFLTYDMFLEKVLKDTDWNYQIMSGDLTNINMGKEVHFSNGKNIYALLQDSIQEFGGVELEFRAEYAGGSLNKTVYAYPHKGRGSFVGQRFEYGHNVAGIKKKQEVVDGLDENEEIILYEGFETVDGLNTELTYEVDFALRGYEVEELEIGDTHYIIDNDFEPAQFEARIGKIEISFSDPTKNKCYIANFKRITGSKPDNLTSDNIEDVVDDNLDDKLDELLEEKLGENFGEHNHDRLVYHDEYFNNDKIMKFTAHPSTVIEDDGSTSEGNSSFTLDFNNQMEMYLRARDNSETGYPNYNWLTFRIYNGISSGNYYTDVFTNSENVVPYYHELQYIGTLDRRWRAAYIENVFADYVGSIKMESCTYQLPFDRKDMIDVSEITESSSINKQDLLDFILNDVNIYKYMYKDTDKESEEAGLSDVGTYLGILSDSFMDHQSEDNCTWTSEVASLVMRNIISDTDNDGDLDDETKHKSHTYNLPALVTALIGAFQQHVEDGDDGGNIDLSAYATKTYVNDAIDDIELTPGPKGDKGEQGEPGEPGEDGVSVTNVSINSSNHLITTLSDNRTIDAGALPSGGSNGGELPSDVFEVIDGKLHIKLPINFEDSANFINCGLIDNKANLTGAVGIEAMTIYCASINPVYDGSGIVTISGDLEVTGNITSANSVATVNEDLLEEQQNTIQQQQETIASLEARIARLEEILGINNN